MSYATLQNLLDRGLEQELIELTDTTNQPPTTIDPLKVQDALDDADAEINSYITASNIPTPLNPVPRVIMQRAIVIARYFLWKDNASDKVQADYAAAVGWLKLLAAGAVNLGDNIAPTEQPSSSTPQISAPCRIFTRDTLSGL